MSLTPPMPVPSPWCKRRMQKQTKSYWKCSKSQYLTFTRVIFPQMLILSYVRFVFLDSCVCCFSTYLTSIPITSFITPPLPVPSRDLKRRSENNANQTGKAQENQFITWLEYFSTNNSTIFLLNIDIFSSSFIAIRSSNFLKNSTFCKILDWRVQILQESCQINGIILHYLARLLARFLEDSEFFDH